MYNAGSTTLGGSTLGSSLGGALGISSGLATAGIGLVGAGIGALVNSLTRPNNPDKINVQGAESEGMQVNPDGKLPSGNSVLFDNSLGVGAGTQSSKGSGEIYQLNPEGNAKDNTVYHWIGQNDSTALENDASALNKDIKSGGNADSTLASISDIYNSTGGEQGWGMSEASFVESLHSLLDSGVYSSGNAFGSGN